MARFDTKPTPDERAAARRRLAEVADRVPPPGDVEHHRMAFALGYIGSSLEATAAASDLDARRIAWARAMYDAVREANR